MLIVVIIQPCPYFAFFNTYFLVRTDLKYKSRVYGSICTILKNYRLLEMSGSPKSVLRGSIGIALYMEMDTVCYAPFAHGSDDITSGNTNRAIVVSYFRDSHSLHMPIADCQILFNAATILIHKYIWIYNAGKESNVFVLARAIN